MWFFGKKAKTAKPEDALEKRREAEKSREKELEEQLAVEKNRLSELTKKLEELKTAAASNPGSIAVIYAGEVKAQRDLVNERISMYESELETARRITKTEA